MENAMSMKGKPTCIAELGFFMVQMPSQETQ